MVWILAFHFQEKKAKSKWTDMRDSVKKKKIQAVVPKQLKAQVLTLNLMCIAHKELPLTHFC
jgi:hypothetical protein